MSLYTIRLKLFYISRSYIVTDSNENKIFSISGKLRFARTFVVKGHQGHLPLTVREKLLSIDRTFLVTQQGNQIATVRRTTTTGEYPERFTIELDSSESLKASGSLYSDRGISITKNGSAFARIWRKDAFRETFGLETTNNLDQALLLSIAMSIVETDSSRGRPTN